MKQGSVNILFPDLKLKPALLTVPQPDLSPLVAKSLHCTLSSSCPLVPEIWERQTQGPAYSFNQVSTCSFWNIATSLGRDIRQTGQLCRLKRADTKGRLNEVIFFDKCSWKTAIWFTLFFHDWYTRWYELCSILCLWRLNWDVMTCCFCYVTVFPPWKCSQLISSSLLV